jgi:hypothetical protein
MFFFFTSPKQLQSMEHNPNGAIKIPNKLNNIENNIQAQEYKQLNQMLSPLKREVREQRSYRERGSLFILLLSNSIGKIALANFLTGNF